MILLLEKKKDKKRKLDMINRWINFGTIGDKFPQQEYKQSAEEV